MEVSGTAVLNGGAIYSLGSLTLDRVTISNSLADGFAGGGIFCFGNFTLTITNSTITNNSAQTGGGGIANQGCTATISNTLIANNSVSNPNGGEPTGGGISNNGTLTITKSTIRDNTADLYGGGINNTFGTLVITNSTVSGNVAHGNPLFSFLDGQGGGISNRSAATLFVNNSTISNNTAEGTFSNGGGIYVDLGAVTHLYSSTITENSANSGGGVWVFPIVGILHTARNTIIANQQLGGDCDVGLSLVSEGYNIESGASCSFTAVGDQQNTDPLLEVLGNYGGPTETHNLIFDFTNASPAVDQGDPAGCVGDLDGDGVLESLDIDQRGQLRHVDVPSRANVCDVGAVEFNLVLNGGMEDDADGDRLPDGWQSVGLNPTDRRFCRKEAHSGDCLFRVRGKANADKEISQTLVLSGNLGDRYEFAVRSAAHNADPAAVLQAELRIHFINLGWQTHVLTLDPGTHDWRKFSANFVMSDAYDQVIVVPIHTTISQGSSVAIDSVSLVPDQ